MVNLMLKNSLRITSYRKNRKQKKMLQGSEKKTCTKNLIESLRKIINNFHTFLLTMLSQNKNKENPENKY